MIKRKILSKTPIKYWEIVSKEYDAYVKKMGQTDNWDKFVDSFSIFLD